MEFVNKGIKLLVVASLLVMAGCATSSTTSQRSTAGTEGTDTMTLEDHLRRLNGVQITGSGNYAKVMLRPRGFSGASRGVTSSSKGDPGFGDSNKRQPLFVVDGQKVGRNYPNVAQMFSAGEIKSVRLLPESEAAQYGSEAGHGVIEITTKAASNDN
ncbi:TonB-dependent receptor [Fodinibius sp.]|uniref:TonB-dependent receptor n=1 Tax=Fodinibius sp. TaxID=1872440 RepID=UPI002ACE5E37|nr:TonB-dependent receptor plug domain-containing protein [Fodinibius sp.]MDZ7659540.1 TonB-dependent receptor plug domain-containing protein [Fodinibius sp.]